MSTEHRQSIAVASIVGSVCVDPIDGQRLCGLICAALDDGVKVDLEFTGVGTLTTSFLVPAIGRLCSRMTLDDVYNRVKFWGLDATDCELIDMVLRDASRFYTASPEQQKAITEVTRRAPYCI